MKKIAVLIVLIVSTLGCKNNTPYTTAESPQLLANHKKVAVLPFSVVFSDEYKKMIREGKVTWEEQGRRAGIDLQKAAFQYLAKRSNKKNFELIIQDYLTTNRTLEESGIPYSQLMGMEKSRIASLLGVDAVIFGTSSVEFNISRGFIGNNGIHTTLDLYDAYAGKKIWGSSDMEYIRGRFDSPQDLAKRTVNDLINSLPYKSVKKG